MSNAANEPGLALLHDLLAAFRTSTDPSVPAERLWQTASARFRSKLGGPDHLMHLFGNPAWQPLIAHTEASVERFDRIADTARATVRVTTQAGDEVHYLASMNQVRERDAWQVSGLVRAELADL